MLKKLKSLLLTDQWFYGALVLLVGTISFMLGRASVVSGVDMGPSVRSEAVVTASSSIGMNEPVSVKNQVATAAVIASKAGTKYHLPTCPGAKQIKEENKVFFESIAAAEAAGYKRAANCPKLP